MFCGQDVCSYVPDTGEQPHQEPQGDSEEGSAAAGSSAGRVCAGVFVVEATPDTEVDVDVDPGRQVPQGDSEVGPSGVASSVGRVCAGVFVVEATPDTEVDVEASTAQDDEDDDGYGYGGEIITDTRPLRARAHRPRQVVTIRRDQACPHGARRPARCTACSAASSSAETSTAMGRPS